jgi:tetratricopeptide (TPR) repeat protein
MELKKMKCYFRCIPCFASIILHPEYKEAIAFYEKNLEISRKTLPPNHSNLASSYNNVGVACQVMGEYSKALSSHEKTLEIRQQSLPSNHPGLASTYYNIGLSYQYMDNYSKAYSFYERTVNIAQISLPSNHPHLQMYQEKFGVVKKKF